MMNWFGTLLPREDVMFVIVGVCMICPLCCVRLITGAYLATLPRKGTGEPLKALQWHDLGWQDDEHQPDVKKYQST